MEAAGLKTTSARAPRKSKGSNGDTPSSSASAHTGHMPSPYQTPYQTPTNQGGPVPYGQYIYDPSPYGGYPTHGIPPSVGMAQNQSASSSRVPSPVNGHSSAHSSVGSIPSAHHHQPYFPQPFSPAYPYGGHMQQQPYRYVGPPAGIPSPYGTAHYPHHSLYSPGLPPEHGQQAMYSSMQGGFPTHSRESSYGVHTPAYGGPSMGNGYPPRTQTSTPLNQSHEDLRLESNGDHRMYGRRAPSPGRRRSPPHDMLAQGVVDPINMMVGRPPMHQAIQHPYSYQPHHMAYGYGAQAHSSTTLAHDQDQEMGQRASISSVSEDGSGNGGSDGSPIKMEGS